MGDGVKGCHITVFIGTDSSIKLEPCMAVPTTDITVQSANQSLCGLLQHVFCSRVTSNLALKCRAGASRTNVCDTYPVGSRVGDTKVARGAASDPEGELTFQVGSSTASRRLEP